MTRCTVHGAATGVSGCRRAVLLLVAVLGSGAAPPVVAQVPDAGPLDALQGYSGLLAVPDAGIAPTGTASLQFNNDLDTDARPGIDAVHNYTLLIGMYRRLELGGRISEAVHGGRRDLSGAFKLQLYAGRHLALAAGYADFAGGAQHLRARYLVADLPLGGAVLSLGYGFGPTRLDGPFGGVRWRAGRHLELLADHDGNAAAGGLRLRWKLSRAVEAYGIARLSTDERQRQAFGVGLRVAVGRPSPSVAEDASRTPQQHGQRPLPPPRIVDGGDAPVDGLRAVARARAGGEAAVVEYRMGVPVRVFDGESAQVAWRPQRWSAEELLTLPPRSLELRIAPDLRHTTATEVGLFDYSLALRSSLRWQGPAGIGAYVTVDAPLASSDDARSGGAYPYLQHRGGLHQAALQWAVHPLPGMFALSSVGRTEVDEVPYDFLHLDWALHDATGRHRLRLAAGHFRPEDKLNFAEHDTWIAGYRWWWEAAGASLALDRGEFFHGDRGVRATFERHFGILRVALVYRRRDNGEQDGGMRLTFPLTGEPLRAGPLRVVGEPHWRAQLVTTIDNPGGMNIIRRGFMVEPVPQYDLLDDLLDGERAFPAYVPGGG